ncbi:MAG: FmdB family zinc ribbon protein [Gemmatimonadota bacterium]
MFNHTTLILGVVLPEFAGWIYRIGTGHHRSARLIIPIYEYSCQECGDRFELLVRGSEAPACPSCESTKLERELSLPTAHTSGTRNMAMRAAKARDQRQGAERAHAQREYELNHDDH